MVSAGLASSRPESAHRTSTHECIVVRVCGQDRQQTGLSLSPSLSLSIYLPFLFSRSKLLARLRSKRRELSYSSISSLYGYIPLLLVIVWLGSLCAPTTEEDLYTNFMKMFVQSQRSGDGSDILLR